MNLFKKLAQKNRWQHPIPRALFVILAVSFWFLSLGIQNLPESLQTFYGGLLLFVFGWGMYLRLWDAGKKPWWLVFYLLTIASSTVVILFTLPLSISPSVTSWLAVFNTFVFITGMSGLIYVLLVCFCQQGSTQSSKPLVTLAWLFGVGFMVALVLHSPNTEGLPEFPQPEAASK